jgi:hypothetical protein
MGNFVKELECYTVPGCIEIGSTSLRPPDAHNLWMAVTIDGTCCDKWNQYFELQYKKITRILNLDESLINYSFWISEKYLLEQYTRLPESCKKIDILIINSKTFSNQYERHRSEMDNLCRFLNSKFNIITTRKVDNIKCTLDYDLRIQDIAAIATHTTYIVAIFTGPVCGLFNIQTKSVIKKWFFIKSRHEICEMTDLNYDMIYDANLASIYEYFKDINSSVTEGTLTAAA